MAKVTLRVRGYFGHPYETLQKVAWGQFVQTFYKCGFFSSYIVHFQWLFRDTISQNRYFAWRLKLSVGLLWPPTKTKTKMSLKWYKKNYPNKYNLFAQLINIQSHCHEIKPRISTFALHSPANSAIFLVAKVAPFLAPDVEITDPRPIAEGRSNQTSLILVTIIKTMYATVAFKCLKLLSCAYPDEIFWLFFFRSLQG